MSTHFLSRTGIDTEDSITAGFSCGLALATSLPEALCSSSPWFASILSRTCEFRSRFEPKRLCGLETEIQPELQYCIDHHDSKL